MPKLNDDIIQCTGCKKDVQENGYCEVDGKPFGDCCWTEHVNSCEKCKELN